MDVYIRSRGKANSKGYKWLKVTKQEIYDKEPILNDKFHELIDSDSSSLSLILSRLDNNLVLYITGLVDSLRKDGIGGGRKINNSLLILSYSLEEELIIKNIVIQALRDELTTKIEKVINFSNNETGFNINSTELYKLIVSDVNEGILKPNLNTKIGNLTRMQELADEIQQLKYLPKQDSYLIVITGICEKDNLEKEKVWRGLSSRIDFHNEDWSNELPNDSNNPLINIFKFGDKVKYFIDIKNWKLFIIPFFFISIFLNILLFRQVLMNESLEKNNQNFRIENQDLKEKNKSLELKINKENAKLSNLESKADKLQTILDNQILQFENVLEEFKK